jgi:hypothetical protein
MEGILLGSKKEIMKWEKIRPFLRAGSPERKRSEEE